jgi:septation ring formation regulator EzrA
MEAIITVAVTGVASFLGYLFGATKKNTESIVHLNVTVDGIQKDVEAHKEELKKLSTLETKNSLNYQHIKNEVAVINEDIEDIKDKLSSLDKDIIQGVKDLF